jgi:hypothetical protein
MDEGGQVLLAAAHVRRRLGAALLLIAGPFIGDEIRDC